MPKFKKILSLLVSMSLIGGTYYIVNASSVVKIETKKTVESSNKKKENNEISENNKSGNDKAKSKKSNQINNKVEKKKTKIKKDTTEKAREIKVDAPKMHYFKIPLKILNCDSPYVKTISLDVFYDKLFEKNILGEKIKPLHLAEKYNLYSLILNKNEKEAIYVSAEDMNEKDLENKIKSKKFKDFIKNFKITSKDFEKSKNSINNILNHDKEIVEKNIDHYTTGKNVELIAPFLNTKDNKKEINREYYTDKIKPLIKPFDTKLCNKIEEKIEKGEIFDSCFRNALKNAKDNEINRFKKTLEKFNSKDNLFKKFKEISFNSNIKNLKIENTGQIERKENLNNFYLEGSGDIVGMHEFSPFSMIIGIFDNLNLTSAEKIDFKHYYEEKLKEYNKMSKEEKSEKNKKEITNLLKCYANEEKKLKSTENKNNKTYNNYESILNNKSEFDEFAKEYEELKENYFPGFIDHLKNLN